MRCLALACVLVVGCSTKEPRRDKPQEPPAMAQPKPLPPCEKPGGTVCVADEVVECLANGELGTPLARCNGGCNAGKCVETCAVRDAELVYTVDSENNLMSFDPRKLPSDPFHTIGKLTCESRGPFSMAVDRNGIAWVAYDTGRLYRVSIINAKCSQALVPEGAPARYGMGFVSDGPNSTTETLFVAEYDKPAFAQLDLSQKIPAWKAVGEFESSRNPELSGTGGGKLFGFFPAIGGGIVSEIDKTTGKLVGERVTIKAGGHAGVPQAWAFAHWGGKFYAFFTLDGNSMVYEVDAKGVVKRVLEHLATRIVGAGVSTCAPLLEQPG